MTRCTSAPTTPRHNTLTKGNVLLVACVVSTLLEPTRRHPPSHRGPTQHQRATQPRRTIHHPTAKGKVSLEANRQTSNHDPHGLPPMRPSTMTAHKPTTTQRIASPPRRRPHCGDGWGSLPRPEGSLNLLCPKKAIPCDYTWESTVRRIVRIEVKLYPNN